MSTSQGYVIQSYKSIVNGQVIKDDVINAKYDGNKMDIDLYENGQHAHMKLNKQDIKSILAKQAHPLSLEKRLAKDFGVKRKSIRKSKSIRKRKSIRK